ncbi:hypothetical protein SEVIR_7G221375v4 [Setaria viridis]
MGGLAAFHSLLMRFIRLLCHGLIRFGKHLDCYKALLRCENLVSIWIVIKL